MSIIEVHGLTKEFHRPRRVDGRFGALRSLVTRQKVVTRAVDGIDFRMEAGEFVGYLGPNGAGKSTTIKMLTGVLVPTSGTVEVAGLVPWRDRERNARRIGVVFGQRTGLWWDLPLSDSLWVLGRLYDLPAARYRESLAQLAAVLDLDGFLDTPVRQLSLGQRVRGDLAAALLHRPSVLYLDEPTIGLDVVTRDRVRATLAGLNRDFGTTVVLTTHDLGDVERLCRRIVIIDHGRMRYDGDVAALKARHAPYRDLVVHVEDPGTLPDLPGVRRVEQAGSRVRLRFDPARVAPGDVVARVLAGQRVLDLSVIEPDLATVVAGMQDELG
ncbi:ABC transporter ATP-binding protein [Rugosimonospora africana]|uniref:ABC transporter ATP-binding protein n=1 Tax=Rugosimonospora africana TaxID=556532 RepID=A0A8J3QYV3_9ACTN|nr:ATP-binding cassette domain-containing protein [Rugosimonospora africana]GIH19789.1 ABC transporter ATP-binding protein [Rugosimonospora africana]